jgi:putative tricarboxylic transport membrane protein
MFFSGLKIILPEKTKDEVNHSHLDYKSVILLVIVSIIYGLTILKVGYFLTTSLFLAVSYFILGERRWIWIFILSFPFVAIFMFLLHGLLNIYLRDPLLQWIGIIG